MRRQAPEKTCLEGDGNTPATTGVIPGRRGLSEAQPLVGGFAFPFSVFQGPDGDNAVNRKKIQFVGGGIIIFGAIVYLSITGMQQGMSYYHEVNEIEARAKELYGKGLRVSGKVQPGSISKTADHRIYNFKVTDGKAFLPVRFEGIVPDLFKDGAEVIVEGKFRQDGVLVASNVMTACPSKYEAEAKVRESSRSKLN